MLDFPLTDIHQRAFKAAEATRCAMDEGKYWEMHDRLFANQNTLAVKDLIGHAEALGLDVPQFQQCLDQEKYGAEVKKDIAQGERAGITGTPTFFFGVKEQADSKIKVLRVIKGAVPYPGFKQAIEDLLSSASK